MNHQIKVVLFDLGRVLMHIDFEAFPNGLGLTSQIQRAPFEQPVKKIVRRYEEGKMSTAEFLDALVPVYGGKFTPEKIIDAFDAIIVSDNMEIFPFVEHVREKYRIAVLSNTCESHWENVKRISSIITLFPDQFTSFHLGAMKPEAVVYHTVCTKMNVQPHEVLFIDDLQENIDGALAVGMNGILFTSVDQLKKDFQQFE